MLLSTRRQRHAGLFRRCFYLLHDAASLDFAVYADTTAPMRQSVAAAPRDKRCTDSIYDAMPCVRYAMLLAIRAMRMMPPRHAPPLCRSLRQDATLRV